MDQVNIPQTGGEPGRPPARAPQRPVQPRGSGNHARWSIGRWAIGRWVIGLGAAIALAGVSVLGLTLSGGNSGNSGSSSGSSGGTAQAAGAVLTGNAAAAAGGGSSGANPKLREARLAVLLHRAMHGQITVASRKGPKTIACERGTGQSVSGGALIVEAADGVTWTWQVGTDTRIFLARHRAGAGVLAAGQRVAVVGLVTGGTDQARRVLIRHRRAGRP
jgi:hypothetical protein